MQQEPGDLKQVSQPPHITSHCSLWKWGQCPSRLLAFLHCSHWSCNLAETMWVPIVIPWLADEWWRMVITEDYGDDAADDDNLLFTYTIPDSISPHDQQHMPKPPLRGPLKCIHSQWNERWNSHAQTTSPGTPSLVHRAIALTHGELGRIQRPCGLGIRKKSVRRQICTQRISKVTRCNQQFSICKYTRIYTHGSPITKFEPIDLPKVANCNALIRPRFGTSWKKSTT